MPSPARSRSTEAIGGYCAIDFGTSNSAIAIPGEAGMRLVELEAGFTTMPTAVFYAADGKPHEPPHREFGRAAIAAYVDGIDGRLMRSMKSILGSSLVEQTTDVGGGRGERYLDIVTAYLAHLKRRAEATSRAPIGRVVLGRPVFFVDDDAAADAKAQVSLRTAAQRAGFREIEFQYEPIAAAFDYEQGTEREEKVLVADIGGGTSDFSIVRVGPGGPGVASARTTSWPTTASTSPAPISIAASSWPPSCHCSATAPTGRQRPPRRRARCRARSTSTSPPGTSSTPSTTRSGCSSCATCAPSMPIRPSTGGC